MRRTLPSWRKYLEARRVDLNDLARLAGITSGYLSLLMSGKRCPSSDVRRRLMEPLCVTRFEYLFVMVRADE